MSLSKVIGIVIYVVIPWLLGLANLVLLIWWFIDKSLFANIPMTPDLLLWVFAGIYLFLEIYMTRNGVFLALALILAIPATIRLFFSNISDDETYLMVVACALLIAAFVISVKVYFRFFSHENKKTPLVEASDSDVNNG